MCIEVLLSTGAIHSLSQQMLFSLLFNLFIIFDSVISGSIGSIPNDNNNRIQSKEPIPNDMQVRDTLSTLNVESEIKASSLNNSSNESDLNNIKPKTLNHNLSDKDQNNIIKSDNHNELATIEKSKESKLVIPERMKNNPSQQKILFCTYELINQKLIDCSGISLIFIIFVINDNKMRISNIHQSEVSIQKGCF